MNEPHAVGALIDRRYRLKREIARGAAGVVYEAEHLYTKRRVAVKLLTLASLNVEETRIRLLREAEALNAARHPGIVQVLDAGDLEGMGPYVVTELLEGRTLQGILAVRQRIGVHETIHVGRQLCDALSAVHAQGLVHRDIKPSNIFVARDDAGREIVKVFDFGIARVNDNRKKLTQHGAVLGTPEYMAPEQLMAREHIDARADVYALGVTLFECLTGVVPFEGNFGEVLLKTATTPLTPVRTKNPMVPAELATCVEKALAREPDERFLNMSVFADALAQIAVPDPGGSLLGLRPPRPAPRAQLPKVAPPPAPQVDQRRRAPRAPYVTPVRIRRASGQVIEGRSEDISVGGLLAVLSEQCAADENVRVSFALPATGQLVEIEATTKWIKVARIAEAVGLQFVTIPPDVRETIEDYVRQMGGT